MRRKTAYLTWFGFHFALIVAIALHELGSLVAKGLTVIPYPQSREAPRPRQTVSRTQNPAAVNVARQTLVAYLHCAGIEGAYGFFAPNVPENYKIVFEFHYPDGRTEYDLPAVQSDAAVLRLGSLLDKIGRTDSEQLRRILVRMLTAATWEKHPGADSARAVFGMLKLPDPAEFARGVTEDYEFLHAYTFSRLRPADRRN